MSNLSPKEWAIIAACTFTLMFALGITAMVHERQPPKYRITCTDGVVVVPMEKCTRGGR